jgi:hypothetical protein
MFGKNKRAGILNLRQRIIKPYGCFEVEVYSID